MISPIVRFSLCGWVDRYHKISLEEHAKQHLSYTTLESASGNIFRKLRIKWTRKTRTTVFWDRECQRTMMVWRWRLSFISRTGPRLRTYRAFGESFVALSVSVAVIDLDGNLQAKIIIAIQYARWVLRHIGALPMTWQGSDGIRSTVTDALLVEFAPGRGERSRNLRAPTRAVWRTGKRSRQKYVRRTLPRTLHEIDTSSRRVTQNGKIWIHFPCSFLLRFTVALELSLLSCLKRNRIVNVVHEYY